MRHRVAGKKLNRSSGHRKALRRNLVTALFQHECIETTAAKAKAIRGQAEKLITLAKRGLEAERENPSRGVHARRLAAGRLNRWVTGPDGTRVDVLEKFKMPRFAYKIVGKNTKGEYVSPMQGIVVWEINKVNKDPIREKTLHSTRYREAYPAGYHLYATLIGAKRHWYHNETIIKCTYDDVVATGQDIYGMRKRDKIIVAKKVTPIKIVRRERNV